LDLSLDQLILYSNGVFITVYILTMMAGFKLLRGGQRAMAGVSIALCSLILVNIGVELIYALFVIVAAWWVEGQKKSAAHQMDGQEASHEL